MAIKILIGGSPCTYWSIAQTNNRETKAEGMGWELFKNYLIAKEKFKPDFFLYENNKSAAQAIKDQIAEELGVGVDPNVRFTYINSALVSAQNRQRFYVTNFGDIEQPEDRGILLKDILVTGNTDREKAHAVISSIGRTTTREYFDKQQGTMALEPVNTDELIPPCDPRGRDKSRTLAAGYQICSQRDLRMDIETDGFMGKQGVVEAVIEGAIPKVAVPVFIGEVPEHKGTYRNGKQASQQYRVYDTEGKGVSVTTSAITNVAEPVRVPEYGNADKSRPVRASYAYKGSGEGSLLTEAFPDNPNKQVSDYVAECIQVGSLPRPNGELSTSQAMRIYSQEGKSVTQSASGGGLGGKTYTVYDVKDGQITIKGKQYPIKLKDGYYIIRKLTVTECARLQTMPDNYCKAVSDSQAYKALGNGWTAEVIIHLLNHALKDVPRDEEIIVLSMYDGIATGRYCLDKMGFTNVTYHAYEIDKYPITIAMDNYPDIVQHGDAFAVREDDWKPPQTRSEWLDELLGGGT